MHATLLTMSQLADARSAYQFALPPSFHGRLANDTVYIRDAHRKSCVAVTIAWNARIRPSDEGQWCRCTFRCGIFEGPDLPVESPALALLAVVLSDPAAARLHRAAGGRLPNAVEVTLHTDVHVAESVVLVATEDAVGAQLDTVAYLRDVIAPQFLDVHRAIVEGECVSDADGRTSCSVAQVVATSACSATFTGAVTLSDETVLQVTQQCAGPPRTLHPLLSTSGAPTPLRTRHPQQQAFRRSVSRERSLDTDEPSSAVRSLRTNSADAVLASNFTPKLTTSARSAPDDRETQIQDLILKWSTLETSVPRELRMCYRDAAAQWRRRSTASKIDGVADEQVHDDDDAGSHEDVVCAAVRGVHQLTNALRSAHHDIAAYVKDKSAQPTRGNVLRFVPLTSVGHGGRSAATDEAISAEAMRQVEDAVQRVLREEYHAVCVGTFCVKAGDVLYVSIAPGCVENFVSVTPPPAARGASIVDVHAASQRWQGTLIATTVVEDLCERREKLRNTWLDAVNVLRPLESAQHSLALRAQQMQFIYMELCVALRCVPIDPTRSESCKESTIDVDGPVSGVDLLASDVLSTTLRLVHDAVDSEAKRYDASRHPTLRSSRDSTWQDADVRGSGGNPLLMQLDTAFMHFRTQVELLLAPSSDPSVWDDAFERVRERRRRVALLHRMEEKLVRMCTLLLPCATTFFSLVYPMVSLATDYRSSVELSHFLKTSAQAQRQTPAMPVLVEREVEAFQLLQRADSSLPHIPPYRLVTS